MKQFLKDPKTWVIVSVTAFIILIAMFAIGKTEYSGNEIVPSVILAFGGAGVAMWRSNQKKKAEREARKKK